MYRCEYTMQLCVFLSQAMFYFSYFFGVHESSLDCLVDLQVATLLFLSVAHRGTIMFSSRGNITGLDAKGEPMAPGQ